MQQAEPRFDWTEIRKATLVAVIGSALYMIIIPVIGAVVGAGSTGPTAGNDIFLWTARAVLWAFIIWRGAAMGRVVGDRIVDDMLVMSAIAAGIWLVAKIVIVWFVYESIGPEGQRTAIIEINDLLAIAAAVFISWLGAKANRF